jgi:hypothetical protein
MQKWSWDRIIGSGRYTSPVIPIFPGTLIIEGAGQLIALWAWAQGIRGHPRLVRTGAEFQRPVDRWSPRLQLKGEVRRKRHLYFGDVRILSDELRWPRGGGARRSRELKA